MSERELFNELIKHYEKYDVKIDQLQRAFMWQAWQASANREGYKLVPVSFLKDINSVAVDEFHKWKIKEEQMPAICEYMQDLSFYIGVEK